MFLWGSLCFLYFFVLLCAFALRFLVGSLCAARLHDFGSSNSWVCLTIALWCAWRWTGWSTVQWMRIWPRKHTLIVQVVRVIVRFQWSGVLSIRFAHSLGCIRVTWCYICLCPGCTVLCALVQSVHLRRFCVISVLGLYGVFGLGSLCAWRNSCQVEQKRAELNRVVQSGAECRVAKSRAERE